MSSTFTENSRLIKESTEIKSFLIENGSDIKGNRAICPICKNQKYTMAIDDVLQRCTCYKGCTNKNEKQTADIIDLYGIMYNKNAIESLNDLISIYKIKRYTGNFNKYKLKINHEFKLNAKNHLTEMHNKLYYIKLFKYDELNSTNNYDNCVTLIESIEKYLNKLKCNNFSENEGRVLYKNASIFLNIINNLND